MLNDFKAPDIKAPRNGVNSLNLISYTLHRRFIKKHPQYKDLKYAEFTKILREFGTATWENVIDYRDGVELPQSLGYLFIATCQRSKKHNTDFPTSIQYSKSLEHRNFESDNHLAKIFYTNYSNRYKFKNREAWSFTAIRQFKRGVAAAYPTSWKKYVVVEPIMRISEIFKSHKMKDRVQKIREATDLTEYNEFNLD
jgi:hypothetical protein